MSKSLIVNLLLALYGSAGFARAQVQPVGLENNDPLQGSGARSIEVDAPKVFTKQNVQDCFDPNTNDGLREPGITKVGDTFFLVAQCRNAKNSGGFSTLDDFTATRTVFTTSTDGVNWSPIKYILDLSDSKGKPIYDQVTKTLILQYNYFGNSSDPADNLGVFQVTSTDLGKTWSKPYSVSQFISHGCDGGPTDRVRLSAGNHVQTPSGRLIFGGFTSGKICIWYSDDHGKTYKVSQSVPGNENSVAALDSNNLFMTSRGHSLGWNGERAAYFSHDGGVNWGTAVKMPFPDTSKSGCAASVYTMHVKRHGKLNPVIFYTGPIEKKRTTLAIHCSWDGGHSWNSTLLVNRGQIAAYSAISEIVENGKQKLLVVWEQKPNFFSYKFDIDWCSK
jgi:hypothetical protein